MSWKAQIDDRGVITRYKDSDTGEVISAKEYERRNVMQQGQYMAVPGSGYPQLVAPGGYSQGYTVVGRPSHVPDGGGVYPNNGYAPALQPRPGIYPDAAPGMVPNAPGMMPGQPLAGGGMLPGQPLAGGGMLPGQPADSGANPLIQPGAQMFGGSPDAIAPQPGAGFPMGAAPAPAGPTPSPLGAPGSPAAVPMAAAGGPPTQGLPVQGKNLRMEGIPGHVNSQSYGRKPHGFLDATSIAILLPTLVLLALIIAAAHKKRLFPWQTIRTFNPPTGLMSPKDYQRSFVCPPNLRRHGRVGKRNPNATWTDQDGIVIPFGFLARTHLPVTIPLGRLPNKNMFIVAPSGSGKTTLMRAIIKALMAKPCVIIALEAKANDPNLDEKREGFKYTVLPEAQQAGFQTLYFNPLDQDSIHWNPLDLDPITFASSIVQDVNSLPPEEQHWAERDHGYIAGLATLLKWGAVQVVGEDENGVAAEVQALPCNPRGLMKLVNNRRNIVESLRRLKGNPEVDPAELSELTQTLSSIIRTDTDWDKNIQGVRGRLRMFKNPGVLRVTEKSNVDIRGSMHTPTVLIFGAPASMGPDAESLAACFVYQLQQALHTRYGTKSVLPLFAFFDEYQTLNIDIAGRLSAIVRGANGGLAVILQNIGQISGRTPPDGEGGGMSELKTIFSNSAVRVCLHNADESTAKFFSDEIGKHAVIIPGISDHFEASGGIFPVKWNRIHSQQVVARVDTDSIKRMEKQHALVYLSPAGDPEFGEAKPFMVDLRGIEEIARLHLLHNVVGRVPPSGGSPEGTPPASPGGGEPFEPPPAPGEQGPPSRWATMAQAAQQLAGAAQAALLGGQQQQTAQPPSWKHGAYSDATSSGGTPAPPHISGPETPSQRSCPHCGGNAGKGKFCIECGRALLPTQPMSSTPAAEEAIGPGSPYAQGTAPEDGAQPIDQLAAYGGLRPRTTQEPGVLPQFPGANLSAASKVTGAAGSPLRPAPRAPGSTDPDRESGAAPATSSLLGRFAQPMSLKEELDKVARSVESEEPSRRAQPTDLESQRAQISEGRQRAGSQRQPLTSLNPDPSRLGLPTSEPRSVSRTRAEQNQPGNGVEF